VPALQLPLDPVLTDGLVVQPAWVEGVVHLAMVVGQVVPPWLAAGAMLVKERLVRQQMQERVDGCFWAWVFSQVLEWSFYDDITEKDSLCTRALDDLGREWEMR
jgi:hypothetical protein